MKVSTASTDVACKHRRQQQSEKHCSSAGMPRKACCEEDCCGPGTVWDVTEGRCFPYSPSMGWTGTYSEFYEFGCKLRRCCEEDCCRGGAVCDNEDNKFCIIVPSPSPAPSTDSPSFSSSPLISNCNGKTYSECVSPCVRVFNIDGFATSDVHRICISLSPLIQQREDATSCETRPNMY